MLVHHVEEAKHVCKQDMLLESSSMTSAHVCTQCDCWRPLRLPAILVADARLGGISTSLSAYETLLARGYDVPFVVLAAGSHSQSNSQAIQANVGTDTEVMVLPQTLPALPTSRSAASVHFMGWSGTLPHCLCLLLSLLLTVWLFNCCMRCILSQSTCCSRLKLVFLHFLH